MNARPAPGLPPGLVRPTDDEPMSDCSVVDTFAGVGWAVALKSLGITEVGIELDAMTWRTRRRHGFRTLNADVARVDPRKYEGTKGFIGSPPCQAWSTAGEQMGHEDPRGALVWEPLRWVSVIRPRWVALEQVVTVMPVWRLIADALRLMGYSAWTGVLDAADYGVPQNRRRAVVMASLDGPVAPPPPTHSQRPSLFDTLPWVTMADALELGPGWEYDSGQNSVLGDGRIERYVRSCDRPAGTLTTKAASQWVLRRDDERRKLSFEDACVLQGFPRDFIFDGNREERLTQLGNAVPPPLGAAIVSALLRRPALVGTAA